MVPGIPSGTLDCWVQFKEPWAKVYVTFFVTFAFGLPLLIIGFSYGAICFKVVRYRLPAEPKERRKQRNKDKPSMSSTSELPSRSEVESELVSASGSVQQNQMVCSM